MTDQTLEKIALIVNGLLKEKGKAAAILKPEDRLYEDGLGLDSMDAAGLSAALEQEFGSDPFLSGQFPRTVGDIVNFYSK